MKAAALASRLLDSLGRFSAILQGRQLSLLPVCFTETKTSSQSSICKGIFVCVEVLRPSQPNGVMSSAVSSPNHTFTGQA